MAPSRPPIPVPFPRALYGSMELAPIVTYAKYQIPNTWPLT